MSALTSLLARDQVVPVRKIEEALSKQVVSGGDMSSVLLEIDALPENTLAAYQAALFGLLPATRDEVMRAPRDAVRLVPREVAEKHRMVPIAVDGRTLMVALARPLDATAEEQIGFLLGYDLVTRVVCDVRVAAALLHHYGIEPTPRHKRLVERLRQRDAGSVPYVAPPEDGKVGRTSLTNLVRKKSSASDWLDDSDEIELPPAESLPSGPRPSTYPPPRDTDPMGTPRGTMPGGTGGMLEARDTELSEPSTPGTASSPGASDTGTSSPGTVSVPRRPSGPPPPIAQVVGVGVRTSRPPPPSVPPREAYVPDAPIAPRAPTPSVPIDRPSRRIHGPLTAARAASLLDEAAARDDILHVFFSFARQFFEYAALFVVHDDVADGRDAFGSGASVEQVQRIAVPLDVPGTFADARGSGGAIIGRLDRSDLDKLVLRDLSRPEGTWAIVHPVAIRGRTVLLFYGDRGTESFAPSDVPELVAFVPRVVDAFEKLILRRKRGAGFSKPDEAPRSDPAVDRSALKAAAMAMGELARATSPRLESGWGGRGTLPNPVPAPAEPAAEPARRPRDLWQPAEEPGREREDARDDAYAHEPLPLERRRKTSSASLEAAGAMAAEVSASPPPRKAPSGVMPSVDSVVGPGEAPQTGKLRSVLGIPRSAPPPPPADFALPALSERPPAPEPEPPSAPPSEDDEPELTMSAVDSAEFDDIDSEPELTISREDEDGDIGGGAYIMRDASVDVVGKARPKPRSSQKPARQRRIDPRIEDDEAAKPPPSREFVNVIAQPERRASDPPSPDDEEGRPSQHPAPANEGLSVIVDMGDSVNALVSELLRSGPDDTYIVDSLLRLGEAALPTLAQAFPGPPWFDRHRPWRRLPHGRDVSAAARALVAYRDRAVPYVASLLDSSNADRRFYAVLVAGDLVHGGLAMALAERVFDDDDGVREAALEHLPSFTSFPEWKEPIAQLRRAAKIRGRDPVRRHRAARALGAVRDTGAMRLLAELLDDEDSVLGEIAHRALVAIACEDMGSRASRWAPWIQKNESRHRVEWLIDALTHADEGIRSAAGEELKRATQQYYGFHPASSRKEREVVQQKYRKWWQEHGAKAFG